MKRSDVDDILEKWLNGEDVSDEDIWGEWDVKYEEDADGTDVE